MNSPQISIVIPAFNEEKNLPLLIKKINQILKKTSYEIIIVNDGSSDNTTTILQALEKKQTQLIPVNLYRNFGHQAALIAGIDIAHGQAIITMDADFQHPPELITTMILKWKKGHDLVLAQKQEDMHTELKSKIARKIGYVFYPLLTGNLLIPGVSDFRLMDREILEYIKQCHEYRLILRGMVMIPAKNPILIPYTPPARLYGKSTYTLAKLYNLFIYSITSISVIPLRFALVIGLLIMATTFSYCVYVLTVKVILHQPIIQGWPALAILTSGLFGMLFFYLGLIGEYIGAIFEEVKHRPRYYIKSNKNC